MGGVAGMGERGGAVGPPAREEVSSLLDSHDFPLSKQWRDSLYSVRNHPLQYWTNIARIALLR